MTIIKTPKKSTVFCFRITLFPLLAFFVSCIGLSAEETLADDIEGLMLNWVGLERQQDVLKNNWSQQQPILQQQLFLLQKEQEELDALLESTADLQGEVERKRLELLEDQTSMEQTQLLVEQSLNQAVVNIGRIFPQLPPPMTEAWQGNLSKFQGGLLTTSERLQLIVDMYTQLDDFQKKITLREAILQLEDGSSFLVHQVYLGLSHGWYLSADGSQAAVGSSTPVGWQWKPSSNANLIAEFISILDGSQSPELLTLPISLSAEAVNIQGQ